jgi:hypothetical protein
MYKCIYVYIYIGIYIYMYVYTYIYIYLPSQRKDFNVNRPRLDWIKMLNRGRIRSRNRKKEFGSGRPKGYGSSDTDLHPEHCLRGIL